MGRIIVFSDGASRGNPGEAGIGYIIKDQKGNTLKQASEFLGQATNNVAEYTALVYALKDGLGMGANEVEIYTDSELMVKQLQGEYRVKNTGLLALYREARGLLEKFNSFNITHVARKKNKEADKLANKGIDEALT